MLYVVATPIGNLGDLSARAVDVLRAAHLIACEDTRRTRILLTHFQIPAPRMVSYREHREESAGQGLLAALQQDLTVALCSDGGFPGISDPGYRLVRLAIEHDIRIEVIPGASAVLTALVLSGLPTSSFTFKGYPPRRPGVLRRFFADEAAMPHTLVIYESPFRVGASLAVALETLGNRQAAVCIELTKKFERVRRGTLEELAAEFKDRPVKGEVTIVIAGNHPKFIEAPEADDVDPA